MSENPEIIESNVGSEPEATDDTEQPNDMEEKLRELRSSNRALFEGIKALGSGLDPSSVMMLRLDTFLAMVLNGDDRLRYEIEFETQMSKALDDVIKQVRQQHITQGVAVPGQSANFSGLVDPTGRPI